MKKTFKYILSALVLTTAAFSCQEIEKVTIGEELTAPVLESHGAIVIDESNIDAGSTTFKIKFADYGYAAAPEYVLYAMPENGTEDDVLRISSAYASEIAVKNSDLNKSAMKMGAKAGEATNFKFYVTSSISSAYPDGLLKSNIETVSITAFEAQLPSPINLPGSHQGWNVTGDPKLYAVNALGRYEGIVDMNTEGGAALEFLIVPESDWGKKYGVKTEGGQLTDLIQDGGSANIKCVPAGHYRFVFDSSIPQLDTMRINQVGLVGSAIDGVGWSETNDFPMTYNKANRTWEAKVTVSADGEFKIRFNKSGWSNLMGSSSNTLEDVVYAGGENIKVPAGVSGEKVIALHTDAYPYYVTITDPL